MHAPSGGRFGAVPRTHTMPLRRFATPLLALLIAACTSSSYREPPRVSAPPAATPPSAPPPPSGKYYLDDGPGESAARTSTPFPTPCRASSRCTASPTVRTPCSDANTCRRRRCSRTRSAASRPGTAASSTAQKTSIGETYDMYGMTAAHPTLPLPSYARVTSVAPGKSVVVRVNDRGPFLHGRIIDLSYAAAHRLGIAQNGSGEVDVQAILPGSIAPVAAASQPPLPAVASAPAQRRRSCRRRPSRESARPTRRRSRRSPAVIRCSSARLQILQTRRLSSRTRRTNSSTAQVEAKIRQVRRTLSRLYRPVSRPRRGEAHRRAHHAGIGFRDYVAPH